MLSAFNAVAACPVTFGIFDEIGVAICQPPILKAHICLFPADHPIAVVIEDQYGDVQFQANCRLHFLAVHHKAAVAADGQHLFVRVQELRRECTGDGKAYRSKQKRQSRPDVGRSAFAGFIALDFAAFHKGQFSQKETNKSLRT